MAGELVFDRDAVDVFDVVPDVSWSLTYCIKLAIDKCGGRLCLVRKGISLGLTHPQSSG